MDLIRFLYWRLKSLLYLAKTCAVYGPRFPSCRPQQSRPCTRHGKKVPGWHPQLKLASIPGGKSGVEFSAAFNGKQKTQKNIRLS